MITPKIILLNGASSSGKSTLVKELIPRLSTPYFYYSSDQLVDSGMLPDVDRVKNDSEISWNVLRPKFFNGFHKSIKAFADGGLNLLVEHIVEERQWFNDLVNLLSSFDVFYIGVTCPIEIIEEREIIRGNRKLGEGRSHIEDGIHTWSDYDITVDTYLHTAEENAQVILQRMKHFDYKQSIFQRSLKTN